MKRTPLKSRRSRPRRAPAVTCSVFRCKFRPRAEGLCRTHLTREADRLFSLYIRNRDGVCQECGTDRALQAAHRVSRRYHAVRWDDLNCVALCASCHRRFTTQVEEWRAWCRDDLGAEAWEALKWRSIHSGPMNAAVVVAEFRKQAA